MDPALWEALGEESDDRELEAIVRLNDPRAQLPGVRIVSRFGDIATCRVPREKILETRGHEEVASLKAARLLGPEQDVEGDELDEAVLPSDERRPPDLEYTGAGVVLGVLDWGMDVACDAFRNADGGTRVLALWDQRGPGTGAHHYGYGTIHSRADIDAALRTPNPYERLRYHPAEAARGATGSHGAHVADIAAGNGRAGGPAGIAPEADIVFVHLATDARGRGELENLGSSVRIAEAIEFCTRLAAGRPLSLNLSVGRHGGPHDSSTALDAIERHVISANPRAPVLIAHSAGNYHQANCHLSKRLRPGETHLLRLLVPEGDRSTNEVEVWLEPGTKVDVRLRAPDGAWSDWVGPGERRELARGSSPLARIYNRERDPQNGCDMLKAFVLPSGGSGEWQIEVKVRAAPGDGSILHAWIERDDACASCQSRFPADEADPSCTLGTLATGELTLAAGALDGHDPARSLARFSSGGPTRGPNSLMKPDIVAPGVRVLGARSTSFEGDPRPALVRKSGTSMAAPHVAGCAALMLQASEGRLSATELRELMLKEAEPHASGEPERSGRGCLNIRAAVEAAARLAARRQEGRKEIFMPSYNIADDLATEDSEAKKRNRHFVLVSGGPGPFDTRDVEHDASWANYVTPPLLMTDTAAKAGAFQAADEQVWWFIYKPAYDTRWTEDAAATDSRRAAEVKRVRDKGFGSYVDLLEARAKERGWTLRWLDKADDLWTKLGTFRGKSISRLWYWGHARNDLWLSVGHRTSDGAAVAPAADAIIEMADIAAALAPKFQAGDRARVNRFVGCNTEGFAKAWSTAYGVWSEGVLDKVDFQSIHSTAGEPCLVSGASVKTFSPGGVYASGRAVFSLGACGAAGSESLDLGEPDHGRALIDKGEQLLHGGRSMSSSEFLREVIDDANAWPFEPHAAPYELALLFEALAGRGPFRIPAALRQRLEVVALPNNPPRSTLRPGDVYLRRVPGQPELAHAGMLLSGELTQQAGLAERAGPGGYAPVIEAGAFPHCSHRPFARRILDEHGCAPSTQIIVRPRVTALERAPAFRLVQGVPASDTAEQAGVPVPAAQTWVDKDAHGLLWIPQSPGIEVGMTDAAGMSFVGVVGANALQTLVLATVGSITTAQRPAGHALVHVEEVALSPHAGSGAAAGMQRFDVRLTRRRSGRIWEGGAQVLRTVRGGFEPVDPARLSQALAAELDERTRIDLHDGSMWVWMSFSLADEAADTRRWVPPGHPRSDVETHMRDIDAEIQNLPVGVLRVRVEAIKNIIAAVATHEGSFGARSAATDTHASLGIFQWAMEKNQTAESGSLGEFFRALSNRAAAAAAPPGPEDQLFIGAWGECTAAGLTLVGNQIQLNGVAANGQTVEARMQPHMARRRLRTYQLVAALDWINAFRDTVIRPGPSVGRRIFGGNYTQTDRAGLRATLQRAGSTFELDAVQHATVGQLLPSTKALASAVTLGVNRPHFVEAAAWKTISGNWGPTATGDHLDQLIAVLRSGGARLPGRVTQTTIDAGPQQATLWWTLLRRALWPTVLPRADMEWQTVADFRRHALRFYNPRDARRFHRERRFSTLELMSW